MGRSSAQKLTDSGLKRKFELIGYNETEIKVRLDVADTFEGGKDVPFRIITYRKEMRGWTVELDIEVDGVSVCTIPNPDEEIRAFWKGLRQWAEETERGRKQTHRERVVRYVEKLPDSFFGPEDELPF